LRNPVAIVLAASLLAAPSVAFAVPQQVFFDDMESGPGLWVVDTAIPLGAPWAIVTTQSHSPTHSWFTDDPNNISDKRVAFANDVGIGGGAVLSFWMWIDIEDFPPTVGYDAMVLEYSLNGGMTWTDILAAQGSVPADPGRITQTPYNRTVSTGFGSPLGGRPAWSGENLAFQEVRVNLAAFAGLNARFRWRFASDDSVAQVGVWVDDVMIASALEPVSITVDAPGNGVLELNETGVVAPTWRNTTAAAIMATGAMTNFTGPAGPMYSIPDASASYGSIAAGGTAACTSDCYSLRADAGTRPAVHMDGTVRETLNGTTSTDWTIHVGGSFSDVSTTSPFYRFVETLLHTGVTGGCGADVYCPSTPTTREQMAVFVLAAKEGAGYAPPPCTVPNLFSDVPETSPFCRFIEELANRGVVAGCGPNIYCPTANVTREQMAIFVLRTLDPALNPPACTTPMFSDVPASSPFCRWIEELARRGVVTGCGGGNYCPTAPVTREQMGVFLSVTFGLTLYGL
jgi:hypothetical protein